jgi:hypothetical protein
MFSRDSDDQDEFWGARSRKKNSLVFGGLVMSGSGQRIWYFYNGVAQVGPITEEELRNLISDKSVALNHHVFRDGFENWKLLADVPELLNPLDNVSVTPPKRTAPRAPIHELVVAHNDRHIASGTIRNISLTGLFFETHDSAFKLNEEIKLTLKEGRGLGKPVNLKGVVVRSSQDEKFPRGYGLELRDVDETTQARIVDYIKRHQTMT